MRSESKSTNARTVRVGLAVAMIATIAATLGAVGTAAAAVTPTKDPLSVARAISDHPAFVLGAAFDVLPPAGTPAAVSTDPLAGFWTSLETPDFAILSTGETGKVVSDTDPAQFARASDDLGGEPLRGGIEHDVTMLRIDVQIPHGADCLSFDYRFLSEESSPEDPASEPFDDAFIAELDSSSWTAVDGDIDAPLSFAVTPTGDVVTVGNAELFMTTDGALGTAFDRATPIWQAWTTVRSGEKHTIYLTLFDGVDSERDSAVFIDRLAFGTSEDGATCTPGSTLVAQVFADQPVSVVGGANGYRILVEAVGGPPPSSAPPLSAPIQTAAIASISSELPQGFSYIPGSTTGSTTADPAIGGVPSSLIWPGALVPAEPPNDDAVELRFGVFVTKKPGTYTNTVSVKATSDYFLLPPVPGAPIDVVIPSADLAVAYEQSPSPARLNGKIKLRLLVTNNGPQAATGTALEAKLPTSFLKARVSSTQGTCDLTDALVGYVLKCGLGLLAPGQTVAVSITGVLDGPDLAIAANATAVEDDPNSENNTLAADAALIAADDKPTPVVGETVATKAKNGKIKVKPPEEKSFVALETVSELPVGTTIDARKGEVKITAAGRDGELQAASFAKGKFVVRQKDTGLTTLKLLGGDFSKCGSKKLKNADRETQKFIKDGARGRRVIRRLWGRGKGRFRTRGRYAAATVRGTVWRTVDRCDGTLIRVTEGVVIVRDVNRKRAVKVKAGQQYLVKRVRAGKKIAGKKATSKKTAKKG